MNSENVVTFRLLDVDEELLAALRDAELNASEWSAVFGVYLADAGGPADPSEPAIAVAARYGITAGAVELTPRFRLQPGVSYRVSFGLVAAPERVTKGLAGYSELAPVTLKFALPDAPAKDPTRLVQVFPIQDTLPENQLKLYLLFSAPMSRGDIYRHIHLLAPDGAEVDLPFLEIDQELWDPTGTRLTLLFDPGRIKRGLRPREEAGPILEEGEKYRLLIDRQWLDAGGQPLVEPFVKGFAAAPPDDTQPDPKTWTIDHPRAGSTQAVLLRFPEPLDHGMLQRVLHVQDATGKVVAGTVKVADDAMLWQFAPKEPWSQGTFQIVVETTLEDLAGNSIERPFEVDALHPVEVAADRATTSVEFHPTSDGAAN